MTQGRLLGDLSVILIQVVFWVNLMFVVSVSLFWPWWKTDFGLTIVLKTACIAAILLPANLALLFGINVMTYFWRWETIITFAGVAVIVTWRGIIIWVLQRDDPPASKDARTAYHSAKSSRRVRKTLGASKKQRGSS